MMENNMDEGYLYDKVCEAIGQASGCWDELVNAGVYDSSRAKEIAESLNDRINKEIRKARIDALTDYINLGSEKAKLLLELIENEKKI
jgi:hypothetical protein